MQPTVEGPVPGAPILALASYDLSGVGYVAEEWLLGGTARSYRATRAPAPHGRWDARPDGSAEFLTRMVVVRPTDAARFDGTVLLEWLNVSSGEDLAAEWLYCHRQVMRTGAVWVGVSAQRAGVFGGGFLPGKHLMKADAQRYAQLRHPGDACAFDIFSQAAAAVRDPNGPLTGMSVRTVLATGASQSAICLVTYVNAIDPLAQVVDGVLLHGRAARGAWVDGAVVDPLRLVTDLVRHGRPALPGHRIRDDVRVPVLTVQSETDVVLLGGSFARQPDTERTRLWEIAGAAHFDSYGTRASMRDSGSLTPEAFRHALRPVVSPRGFRTSSPINSGPQQHYVLQAAMDGLRQWAQGGPGPAPAELLATHRLQPLRLRRTRSGRALGGVRSPWIDAPVATLSGLGQRSVGLGALIGTTRAWSAEHLAAKYPGGKPQYVETFTQATQAAVDAGFLLAEDQAEVLALGRVGWPPDCPEDTAAVRLDERATRPSVPAQSST